VRHKRGGFAGIEWEKQLKLKPPTDEYLAKAAGLSRDEAERLFSRMRGKLARKFEHEKIPSLEAVAMQLQMEDEDLQEWRARWRELSEQDARHSKGK